jgi:hypothetical protein
MFSVPPSHFYVVAHHQRASADKHVNPRITMLAWFTPLIERRRSGLPKSENSSFPHMSERHARTDSGRRGRGLVVTQDMTPESRDRALLSDLRSARADVDDGFLRVDDALGEFDAPTGVGISKSRILNQFLLLAIFLRAEPLCIAMWSVLSLLIRYCGSFLDAWTVYPLNLISEVIRFLIVPRTRPASEFHST